MSVTRVSAPKVRRLSVAVVIDKTALAKASPQEIAGLTRIIQGAVGYDSGRGDIVEVQLRSFVTPAAEPLTSWYEKPVVQDNAPMIGLAALLLIVGVIAALMMHRRKPVVMGRAVDGLASDNGLAPIDGGILTPASAIQLVDYSEKLGTTRGLVDDDADRASAVARQMLAATR